MHTTQRQQTIDLLKSQDIDRALFTHPDTLTWLTGFAPPIQLGVHHFSGGPSLLWYADGHWTLIALDAHAEFATSFADEPDGTLITYEGYTIQHPIASADNLPRALADLLGTPQAGSIGVELRHLTVPLHATLINALPMHTAITPLDGWLIPLRMVKTDEELVKLRRNFALTDTGHAAAREAIQTGVREIDVWAAIHGAINREAGLRVPLGNDCVVTDRSPNNIGGWPLDHPIRDQAGMIIDLSTGYLGYWSDSCGTYFPQEMTARQSAIYRMISDALDYAISLVKPGVIARELDAKVRAFVEQSGHPVYPHHTGHGVGASMHEEPRIVPYNDTALQAGMVIMLEPGTYYPGEVGIRLEHGILVTDDGAEVLTKHI